MSGNIELGEDGYWLIVSKGFILFERIGKNCVRGISSTFGMGRGKLTKQSD